MTLTKEWALIHLSAYDIAYRDAVISVMQLACPVEVVHALGFRVRVRVRVKVRVLGLGFRVAYPVEVVHALGFRVKVRV